MVSSDTLLSMINLDTLLLAVIGTSIPLIPVYREIRLRHKEFEDNIIITGYYEHPNDPIDNGLGLSIRNLNTTTIYTDKIMYNNNQLQLSNRIKPYFRKIIEPGGGVSVRVPNEIQTENAEIRVMNGKKTLKRVKFEDIQINQ